MNLTASKLRECTLFLLASLALCAAVFGDALLGRSLLAPVDIAPAMWSHFRFVDPATNGIPGNHHIADQLGYDLPLQWTIYHAYRAGEIPWWDPYTSCGRPMLADAHINGTDPVRVPLYLALPWFELAYNWTLVLHVLIGGAGFYCLLRRLHFAPMISGPLALAGQFAGANALYFGHPWINATFAWYPWLWLAWHAVWQSGASWGRIAAPLLTAAALYAGNLQSHAYLPLFSLAFLIGYGWRKMVPILAWSGLLGALIAIPVLLPELELFIHNDRVIAFSPVFAGRWFDGLLLLSSIHPWTLGTFRTVTYGNLGFHAFIGGAALGLAAMGIRAMHTESAELRAARRCALSLVGVFMVILSTPLQQFLYTRSAGLAVAGLVVLAAFGCDRLSSATQTRLWAWAFGLLAAAIAVGSQIMVSLIYPHFAARVAGRLAAHALDDGSGGLSRELRAFQARNFPHEITFTNPEVLASWLGLVALTLVLARVRWRSAPLAIPLLLAWNLVPLLLYTQRFVPHTPLVRWKLFRDGSATQQAVAATLAQRNSRLLEIAPAGFEMLFPEDVAHFLRVHTVKGYAALVPRSIEFGNEPTDPRVADFFFETTSPDDPGTLRSEAAKGACRFAWESGHPRPVIIVKETMNRIELAFPAGPAESLLRTDTAYPGWVAHASDGDAVAIERRTNGVSIIAIPEGAEGLILQYRPTGWPYVLAGPVLAAGALLGQVRYSRRRLYPSENTRDFIPV